MSDQPTSTSDDAPTFSAMPARLPLKNPLMKLRASAQTSVFSSPSDNIMSPATKLITAQRQRNLMKTKGINLTQQLKDAVNDDSDSVMSCTDSASSSSANKSHTAPVNTSEDDSDMMMTLAEDTPESSVMIEASATLEEMPGMDVGDVEANENEQTIDESSDNASFITALPKRSLRHPSLMKLRSSYRASAVSSPSDKLMSPASQQLQLHRHRRLPRSKGTSFNSRLGQS
ncbi:hypothetical protein BDF22DRAFT_688869 [Syncephalis plumigaleata]|nr:hypothetical protein BDF22DRAFT_688869 [Syncephalis plumigaleata]